jgi:hypothetical protein
MVSIVKSSEPGFGIDRQKIGIVSKFRKVPVKQKFDNGKSGKEVSRRQKTPNRKLEIAAQSRGKQAEKAYQCQNFDAVLKTRRQVETFRQVKGVGERFRRKKKRGKCLQNGKKGEQKNRPKQPAVFEGVTEKNALPNRAGAEGEEQAANRRLEPIVGRAVKGDRKKNEQKNRYARPLSEAV